MFPQEVRDSPQDIWELIALARKSNDLIDIDAMNGVDGGFSWLWAEFWEEHGEIIWGP